MVHDLIVQYQLTVQDLVAQLLFYNVAKSDYDA